MIQLPNRLLYDTSTVLILIFVVTLAASPTLPFILNTFQPPHQLRHRVDTTNEKSVHKIYCNINDCKREQIINPLRKSHRIPTELCMAGSKSLNKQAALRQKLEQAKLQNFEQQQQNATALSSSYPLSDKEIRERNDRLRFEELLQKKGGAFIDSENDKEYKSRQQEDDEIDAVRKFISTFISFIEWRDWSQTTKKCSPSMYLL